VLIKHYKVDTMTSWQASEIICFYRKGKHFSQSTRLG